MTSSSAPGDHLKALGATPGVTRTTAPFWIWLEWELGGMGEWWAGVSPTLWKCKSLAAEMNDPAGWQAGFPVGDICHFHSPARSPPLPSPPLPPNQVAAPCPHLLLSEETALVPPWVWIAQAAQRTAPLGHQAMALCLFGDNTSLTLLSSVGFPANWQVCVLWPGS